MSYPIPKTKAAAAADTCFPLFSSLPRELRDQIWRNAMPSELRPALYLYRKGCWRPRRLLQHEEGYDPENDEYSLSFEFRYDLLDDTQLQVLLAFVQFEVPLVISRLRYRYSSSTPGAWHRPSLGSRAAFRDSTRTASQETPRTASRDTPGKVSRDNTPRG
jgi:2EXR family